MTRFLPRYLLVFLSVLITTMIFPNSFTLGGGLLSDENFLLYPGDRVENVFRLKNFITKEEDPDFSINFSGFTNYGPGLTILEEHFDVDCYGNATGSIYTKVQGGVEPYSYFWSASGGGVVPVGQENQDFLTGLVAGDYTVIVIDAIKQKTSLTITISQSDKLIATAGSNAPVCEGSTLNLTVTVQGGTSPYTYFWKGPNGFNSTLQNPSIPNMTAAMSGVYLVMITDANGCSVQASVKVVVNSVTPATIGTNQILCNGGDPDPFTVTVPAGGNGVITYQWQSSTTGCAGPWTDIPLATAPDYDVPAGITQTTFYRQVVTSTLNGFGCQTVSNCITVTVQTAIAPGTIGVDQTLCNGGDPAAITGDAGSGGSGTIIYRWESYTGSGPWTIIPSATGISYDPAGSMTVTTQYRRTRISIFAGDTCESVPSNVVTITIQPVVFPGAIGSDQQICQGGMAATLQSLTNPSGGNPSLMYQWQVSTNGILFTDIGGANTLTYSPGALSADRWYRRATHSIQNGVTCTVYSNVVRITVININPGSIAASPTSFCEGGDPSAFTSNPASGDGTFTYQWQSSPDGITYTDIPGEVSQTYDPPAPILQDTWYRRKAISATDTSCVSYTNVIALMVNNLNPGSISMNDLIQCYGSDPPPFISVAATGDANTFSYQWQSSADGLLFSNISGATAAVYDPGPLTADIWYRRIVTASRYGITCSDTSNTVKLSVYPSPSLTVTPPGIVCQAVSYSILASATGTGTLTPVFTLRYVSGTYITPPLSQTNTTGIFTINPPADPEVAPVGQQVFMVTVTNTDAGACADSLPVVVEIYDVPDITLTASCASLQGYGSITMTGVVTYPPTAVVEYSIDGGVTWTQNPVFANLPMDNYTVIARNSLDHSCSTSLSGNILSQTVTTTNYEICENGSVPAGQGLTAVSYCFTWANANANTGVECTNPSQVYYRTNQEFPPYVTGPLVQYKVYGVVKTPVSQLTIKDCPTINGSYSIYQYPFDPAHPEVNLIRWMENTCPGGPSATTYGLDTAKQYVIVLNSPNATDTVCSEVQFTTADKIQIAVDIAPVQWYLSPTATTSIATGTPFNPLTTNGSGITGESCPGTYTFFAGCAEETCREPAFFTINPIPVVVAVDDTICSGQVTNIVLTSIDSCNNPVDTTTVVYEWTASVVSGSATGFTDCTTGCGSVIAQQLTSTSPGTCPIVRYMVRARVSNCYGTWYPVDVLVVNDSNTTLPVPPPDTSYSCRSLVPPPGTLSTTHGCLGTWTVTGVDTDNGGSGCPSSPLIITRTWAFHDGCVNFSVSQQIRIVDSIPPTFTQPPDMIIYSDAFCDYDATPAVTGDVTDEADNCSTGLEAVYTDVTNDGSCPGNKIITRTWTLEDNCQNSTTHIQMITVLDTISPTFNAPGDITIGLDSNCSYTVPVSVTGDVINETDNCSTGIQATYQDVTDNSNPCSIIVTRTWSLIDYCNNAAADQVQVITVNDLTPPVFTRPPDITVYTDSLCNYDAGIVVTGDVTDEHDNCSTGLEATYSDAVNPGPCEGSFVITRSWSLTDHCGNVAPIQNQTITVSDTIPPSFTRPADITIYADTNCNYNATLPVTGDVTNIHDNCSTGITATYADVLTDGSCIGEKIIHRTWSLADKCGNRAPEQVQTITVRDIIPPHFLPIPDTIHNFCVIDLISAGFYPDTVDITPVRPDYFVLDGADKNRLDLNPATFMDNCTPSTDVILHWRIDFDGGNPAPITGTGQVSAYPGPIIFPGAPVVAVTHTISYWLEDDCGNLSSEVVIPIIINPRPDVIKMTY